MLVSVDMSLHSSLPKRRDTTFFTSVFDGFAMQLNAKKIWQWCGHFLNVTSETYFYFDNKRTAGDSYLKG